MGFAIWSEALHGLSLSVGGGQESDRRSGTPNLPGAAALAEAFVRRSALPPPADLAAARDRFEAALAAALPVSVFLGSSSPRLWNTSFLLLPPGSDNLRWVLKLDRRGFSVGTGSACSSLGPGSSRTLAALGLSASDARRTLRFSAGWDTPPSDWSDLAAACLATAAELSAETTL